MPFKESDLNWKKSRQIIGVDEVGRGPLAGPVVACAVSYVGNGNDLSKVLARLREYNVTDSKKLSSSKRATILKFLGISIPNLLLNQPLEIPVFKSHCKFSLVSLDNKIVDKINILQASLEAMEICVNNLTAEESPLVWIDGNKVPPSLKGNKNVEAIIKGDSKSAFIALSSIIAKEFRDTLMKEMAALYPGYGFESHSGYPTKKHKEAIEKCGVTPIHRLTFKGVKEHLPK